MRSFEREKRENLWKRENCENFGRDGIVREFWNRGNVENSKRVKILKEREVWKYENWIWEN